jgi:hypothetical protein
MVIVAVALGAAVGVVAAAVGVVGVAVVRVAVVKVAVLAVAKRDIWMCNPTARKLWCE